MIRRTVVNSVLIVVLIGAFFAAAGCSSEEKGIQPPIQVFHSSGPGGDNSVQTSLGEASPEADSDLRVWSYFDLGTPLIEAFEKQNPGIRVKVETFAYDDMADTFISALSEKTASDVMIMDSNIFGQFTAMDGLEDLLRPPYSADQYKAQIPPALWATGLSLDGKRLIAMPVATSPKVTFYREDILRKYGFPADPDELGAYMENPENWLRMAEELKKHDHWINQWDNDPIVIYESTQGMFDGQLHFLRNNETFAEALDMARKVNMANVDANIDMWTENGQNALRSGKLAMVYMGAWGEDQLEAWAPETAGKWRAARLPFGLYGWSGSTSLSITSQSSHKSQAWKFIQFMLTYRGEGGAGEDIPAYMPLRGLREDLDKPHPFLGGQKAYALYSDLAGKMREFPTTPLDAKAVAIWNRQVIDETDKSTDPHKSLSGIEQKIENELKGDIDILRQYINHQ